MKPQHLNRPIPKGNAERKYLEQLLEEGAQSPVIEMDAAEYFNKMRERIKSKLKSEENK